MSDRTRIGVGVVLAAVALVLFLVLRGADSGDSEEGLTVNGKSVAGAPTIRLRDAKPVGGVEELQASSGDRVRFRVASDVAGEVHVHGYDHEKPIRAGGSVSFDFAAKLEGGFEIELHHGGGEEEIAELKVEPR